MIFDAPLKLENCARKQIMPESEKEASKGEKGLRFKSSERILIERCR